MYRAIIFDFDYTLGDSTDGIVLSANYALNQLGIVEKSVDEIRKTIGLSLRDTYVSLTGKSDPKEAALFSEYFKEKADFVMVGHTKLYSGVKESLLRLRNAGVRTGIVTTKFHYRIEQILRKFDAMDMIDFIVGAEDVKIEKPDPEGLLWVMEHLKLKNEEILYVGDSLVDARTAQNAGVNFAGVLTGTTMREDFQNFPNLYIGENVGKVCEYVLFQPNSA